MLIKELAVASPPTVALHPEIVDVDPAVARELGTSLGRGKGLFNTSHGHRLDEASARCLRTHFRRMIRSSPCALERFRLEVDCPGRSHDLALATIMVYQCLFASYIVRQYGCNTTFANHCPVQPSWLCMSLASQCHSTSRLLPSSSHLRG
jgi:hypothetical protein